MWGQLRLDVGCFVALDKPGVKSEAHFPKTLPLAEGATDAAGHEVG